MRDEEIDEKKTYRLEIAIETESTRKEREELMKNQKTTNVVIKHIP